MKKNQTKEQYTEWLNKIAEKNRNNPNHSEQAFIDILDYYNIYYAFEQPIIYDNKDGYYGYIFDFYIIIDDKKFDIEIDGISHTDEDAKLKDQKRDMLAKDHNIKVIRLDSYFVLYIRNIFKKEFTKESFLKWIINECPINIKKDMSEYKEKEFNKKLYNILNKINIIKERLQQKEQINQLLQEQNDLLKEQNDLLKEYNDLLNEQINQLKENKTSKVETSNNQEELPF